MWKCGGGGAVDIDAAVDNDDGFDGVVGDDKRVYGDGNGFAFGGKGKEVTRMGIETRT